MEPVSTPVGRKVGAKTALVTGSTSRIGLAIARALAKTGYNVVLTGFGDLHQLDDLALELSRQHTVDAVYIPADARKPAQIRHLAAEALGRFGAIDIFVNNVGIQHVALLHEFPDERWDEIIAVSRSSAFHATKAVLPGMQACGWGRIVNIASSHGLVASSGKVRLCSNKARTGRSDQGDSTGKCRVWSYRQRNLPRLDSHPAC
jgi:3-hydroxybutyrate dehydrogenase